MCQPQHPSVSSPPTNSSSTSFVNSIQTWHLNSAAFTVVATFIFVQFRALLRSFLTRNAQRMVRASISSLRGKLSEGGDMGSDRRKSSNKKEENGEEKEYVDKGVGSDLDMAIEEHDNILQQYPVELPYHPIKFTEHEMLKRSQLFYEQMKSRRSVRCFSSRPVSIKLVQNLIKTAGTSPSGANMQPWTFCIVQSPKIKRAIREVVEEQEQLNYTRRMGAQWVLDVSHLNVNWNKPYLTEAPYLIVVMKHPYYLDEQGERKPTHYSEQSTSIAVGIMVAAIQNAGLVTVVSTPLNAGSAIREILQRPINEKVSVLLPLGYPAEGVLVPDIRKRNIEDIMRIY
uniref:Nitroreductase domain-containing protein n=2 Tax=Meloidogyne TaxID=189290 RepID=A0A6V7X147_MELEN|nr:unnamed protein product [Meloidogyne enterolobii]